mgnify:FL=1
MTFAVITPTIGSEYLGRCIESLRGQDCTHYIVMDGQEHFRKINKVMLEVGVTHQTKIISLEQNIGKGWYGHRAFAAASFLVNEDVLCYLDEDNWVEPNYIQAFKDTLNVRENQWAYTLRKIVNQAGDYICDDNCESLGLWPVTGDPNNRFHIDTGCFAVPRDIAVKVGHNWFGQWGADRQFFAALKAAYPRFGCTTQHTLNYRLGGGTSRAFAEMFVHGNRQSSSIYGGVYPWHNHEQPNQKNHTPILTYHTTNQKL